MSGDGWRWAAMGGDGWRRVERADDGQRAPRSWRCWGGGRAGDGGRNPRSPVGTQSDPLRLSFLGKQISSVMALQH
jgi:hypothetical protein